jgi:DeoR family transcriptional regulator, fructose operon transcriptional repressor
MSNHFNQLNTRQEKILNLLKISLEVKISELREHFDVTEMTIRRDLEKLEQMNLLKRTFGGAILAIKEDTLRIRNQLYNEEKIKIGKKAAEGIQDNESIFMDGGSTTLQIAKHLPLLKGITVVTNALNIATELMERGITTVLTGGILLDSTASMVGPIASTTLSSMAFDKVFLGASGLSALHGFSNSNNYESEIKKTVIRNSKEVNVVIDHSKFGTRALFSFASIADVHRILTDKTPCDSLRQTCSDAGVLIDIAD